MDEPNETLPAGRARLAAVMAEAGDLVRIADAARALGVSRAQAAKYLSRWAHQGWLRRVGPGAYVPVPLQLLGAGQVLEDPWILVPALFAPTYIGGRTAAEHWDLTEQIFRDIMVFTARLVRERSLEHEGAVFTLKKIREQAIFGTRTVWRGRTKVAVSDVHRTMIDMLDDPSVGGGIQHVADCLEAYLKHPTCDHERLIEYGDRLGNGAVFKRLGFLAERQPGGAGLAVAAGERLTQGHAKLDPAQDCPRLVTRWRLRVPDVWLEAGR